MKRILILFLLTGGIFSAAGQIYVPGEELFYRVSYRAKLVPNTEVATVVVRTSEVELDGQTVYNVFGQGKTLASFRWFFSLDDRYNIWVDTATLRTVRFTSDIHEGGYTFRSRFDYDWPARRVATRWQRRTLPENRKEMALTDVSMDAVSLFFQHAQRRRRVVPRRRAACLADGARRYDPPFALPLRRTRGEENPQHGGNSTR